jgi:SecD/SecF fusion protein
MNYKLKRVLAVLFVVIIVAGWVLTIWGAGPVAPLKDRMKLGLDVKGGVYVVMEAQTDLKGDELRSLMEQTQAVVEERVNQMGLAEPVVTIEGEKRIRVELPGAEDAEEAIAQIKTQEYFKRYTKQYRDIIIVGINYSTKTKDHQCLIEKLD